MDIELYNNHDLCIWSGDDYSFSKYACWDFVLDWDEAFCFAANHRKEFIDLIKTYVKNMVVKDRTVKIDTGDRYENYYWMCLLRYQFSHPELVDLILQLQPLVHKDDLFYYAHLLYLDFWSTESFAYKGLYGRHEGRITFIPTRLQQYTNSPGDANNYSYALYKRFVATDWFVSKVDYYVGKKDFESAIRLVDRVLTKYDTKEALKSIYNVL